MAERWDDDRIARVAIEATDVVIRSRFPTTRLTADEVIGRVYLRLVQIRDRLAKHDQPIAYARACAYFEAIKTLNEDKQATRKDRHRHIAEQQYCFSHGIEDDTAWVEAADQQRIDDQDELSFLLATVSTDQQDVLIGIHVYGWSFAEMSENVHKSRNWASSTMAEALKRARGQLMQSQMWEEYRHYRPDMQSRWIGVLGPPRPHGSTTSTTPDMRGYEAALGRMKAKSETRWRRK